MLLAKINPPAKTVRQESPFASPVEVKGEWMRVTAERYEMGATKVRFNVSFGYLVQVNEDKSRLEVIHRASVELAGTELEDWGTDDSVIFEKVSGHFNIEVVEVEEKNIENDF